MPGSRVLVRVDGSEHIGGGHVMRCLTLADALSHAGASITFVSGVLTEDLARRIVARGYALHRLCDTPQTESADAPVWDSQRQKHDAEATLEHVGARVDGIVIDHYRLDAFWQKRLTSHTQWLLAIDDLANRKHVASVVVDQGFGRRAQDYAGLVPADCNILAGARFAMLRPEFAALRSESLARRARSASVQRILVSLGATDVGGHSEAAVRTALAVSAEVTVDCVLGGNAPSLAAVQALAAREPRLAVHVDSNDLATLMSRADVAIGAGGTSTWERCCLGLPTATLVVADNQRRGTEALAVHGATLLVDTPDALTAAVRVLANDAELRQRMTHIGSAVTDGRGVERVTAALQRST